jgi:hypothetical protein
MLSAESLERLRRYAQGGSAADPQPGFWTKADLERGTS